MLSITVVVLKKQGQTWSMDLIIAVVIFIAVVAAFYAFLSSSTDEDSVVALQDTAKTAGRRLNCDVQTGDGTCVINKGSVNSTQLEALSGIDYVDLKDELGIQDEFCIYIKDLDGNLIPIGARSGVGSSTLILSDGIRCNEIVG